LSQTGYVDAIDYFAQVRKLTQCGNKTLAASPKSRRTEANAREKEKNLPMTKDQILRVVERATKEEAEEVRFMKQPKGSIPYSLLVFRNPQMAANIDGELSDLFGAGAKKVTVKKSGDTLSVLFSEDGDTTDFILDGLRFSDSELSEFVAAHSGYAPFVFCCGAMHDGRPTIVHSKNPPVNILVQGLVVEDES
jgi:hypothetical protein